MPSLSLWGYFLSTASWVVSSDNVSRHQICLVSDPSHAVCSTTLTPDTHLVCSTTLTPDTHACYLYLVQEADGLSRFTLEDGSGALLLEEYAFSTGLTPNTHIVCSTALIPNTHSTCIISSTMQF